MVKNFSSDPNDGNTLCELISNLEPDFIDMNEANGKPADDRRIEYAENIAEEMNTPSIIDPKDMTVKNLMSSRSCVRLVLPPLRDGEAEGAR